jgi:DNA-binding HxlR family transcriptional regulator
MVALKGYGQFCPVSRAAEILAERWTPLVVRELLCGSTRFNDLQRGVPRMSPALLSRRLRELEHAGIIERRRADHGSGWEYHLTSAGLELRPIIEGMGFWAQRWVRDDLLADQNLDPDLLMWDIRRCVAAHDPPAERFIVQFRFAGMPSSRRHYWLVFDGGQPDLCMRDPGFEIDLLVSCTVRTLTEIWLGHVSVAAARKDGRLELDGAPNLADRFASWFGGSVFAAAGAQPPGQAARPAVASRAGTR